MKTVYIAGKVTGLKYEEVCVKFAAAQERLENRGFKVVNPMEIVPREATWSEAMRICLAALPECQMIYMLRCSVNSRGAKIELQRAIDLRLDLDWET